MESKLETVSHRTAWPPCSLVFANATQEPWIGFAIEGCQGHGYLDQNFLRGVIFT